MANRFAAASGLALAATLFVAAPARAQGFFSFYEMSPRQIVGMLADEGYELRGPMLRRGDVYIADVTSVSGRSARLIVSARDGRVIERFASAPRWRDRGDDGDYPHALHAPRDGSDDREADDGNRHGQMAMGDLFNPPTRVYGGDLFSSRPTPPASIPDADPAPKPKRHTAKKHKDTSVAKAPAGATPDATPTADAPKPADAGSSVADVAPNPAPEPRKPAVEPVKPAAPVDALKPAADTAPKPAATPVQTKAEVEKRAVSEPAPAKPKSDGPRKKLNDLPVGTLD